MGHGRVWWAWRYASPRFAWTLHCDERRADESLHCQASSCPVEHEVVYGLAVDVLRTFTCRATGNQHVVTSRECWRDRRPAHNFTLPVIRNSLVGPIPSLADSFHSFWGVTWTLGDTPLQSTQYPAQLCVAGQDRGAEQWTEVITTDQRRSPGARLMASCRPQITCVLAIAECLSNVSPFKYLKIV